MRKIVLSVLCSLGLYAQVAVVAQTQALSGTTSAIDTTSATLLVCVLSGYNGLGSGCSDSKSNTWAYTPDVSFHNCCGDVHQRIGYVANPTVGSGHTFTTGNPPQGVALFAAFSGPGDHVTIPKYELGRSRGYSWWSRRGGYSYIRI